MKWWRRPKPIDAGEELERIEGERGASSIGSQTRPMQAGMKALMTIATVVVVLFLGWLTLKALAQSKAATNGQAKMTTTVAKVVPGLQVSQPAPDPEPPAPLPAPVAYAPPVEPPQFHYSPAPGGQKEKTPAELLMERRLAPALPQTTSAPAPQQVSAESGFGGSEASDGLAGKLQPMRLKPAKAYLGGNPDFTISRGRKIPCVLDTESITDVPGQILCYATGTVWSDSTNVKLIDRGASFVGWPKGGIVQGQARVFALWEEMTGRVKLQLDSPGAGALGEGGMGGYIDTHFRERFGAAAAFSIIDILGNTASAALSGRGSGSNNNTLQLGGSVQGMQQVAAEALRHNIDIKPTLYTIHGSLITIVVARDLDFSGVYELEPR